jgi:cysteine desulfurase
VTIYLDYAATTPVDPRVAAVMAECLGDPHAQANPASVTHGPGLMARRRVEAARGEVAALIGASPGEIIFTSGATEANNLALLGVARAALRARNGRSHIVSSRTEHKSVLDTCKQLEKEGFAVTLVAPNPDGRVTAETVRAALRADTLLVSLMWVNNEIGAISDIATIAEICRDRGILVHTDASQAVGKLPLDVGVLRVDFLA